MSDRHVVIKLTGVVQQLEKQTHSAQARRWTHYQPIFN